MAHEACGRQAEVKTGRLQIWSCGINLGDELSIVLIQPIYGTLCTLDGSGRLHSVSTAHFVECYYFSRHAWSRVAVLQHLRQFETADLSSGLRLGWSLKIELANPEYHNPHYPPILWRSPANLLWGISIVSGKRKNVGIGFVGVVTLLSSVSKSLYWLDTQWRSICQGARLRNINYISRFLRSEVWQPWPTQVQLNWTWSKKRINSFTSDHTTYTHSELLLLFLLPRNIPKLLPNFHLLPCLYCKLKLIWGLKHQHNCAPKTEPTHLLCRSQRLAVQDGWGGGVDCFRVCPRWGWVSTDILQRA